MTTEYEIAEFSQILGRCPVQRFHTKKEAFAKANRMGAMLIEEDEENPGFYDFLTSNGRTYVMEPVT